MPAYALHSHRVMINGTLIEATLFVRDGVIVEVSIGFAQKNNFEPIEFGTQVIMPGLIDSHVHINEPGRTDWEGFETATKAAALGGITCLVDMPLNSSPVTT